MMLFAWTAQEKRSQEVTWLLMTTAATNAIRVQRALLDKARRKGKLLCKQRGIHLCDQHLLKEQTSVPPSLVLFNVKEQKCCDNTLRMNLSFRTQRHLSDPNVAFRLKSTRETITRGDLAAYDHSRD